MRAQLQIAPLKKVNKILHDPDMTPISLGFFPPSHSFSVVLLTDEQTSFYCFCGWYKRRLTWTLTPRHGAAHVDAGGHTHAKSRLLQIWSVMHCKQKGASEEQMERNKALIKTIRIYISEGGGISWGGDLQREAWVRIRPETDENKRLCVY